MPLVAISASKEIAIAPSSQALSADLGDFAAALTAALSNSSLRAPSLAFHACLTWLRGCSRPSLCGPFAIEPSPAVVVLLHLGKPAGDFGAVECLASRIPSSTRGHASGPIRRPSARRRSASTASPLQGLGSSRNKFEGRGKERRSNFFRAPPRKHSLALGAGPARSLCEG
jgi:hypothetical protein